MPSVQTRDKGPGRGKAHDREVDVMARTIGSCWTGRTGSVISLLAGLGLGVALAVTPTASATAGTGAHQPEILASGQPGALPGDRYLGDFWATYAATDLDVGVPDCLLFSDRKVLFFPSAADLCTTHQGAPVFVEGFTNEISSIEEPFSSDSAVQLHTARDFDYAVTRSLTISVDGGAPVDIHTPQFEAASTQRSVQLPANNLFGVDPQAITLTAHGWVATVRGLSAGLHHIVRTQELDFGDGLEVDVTDKQILVTAGT
jgi:hypothetical protein